MSHYLTFFLIDTVTYIGTNVLESWPCLIGLIKAKHQKDGRGWYFMGLLLRLCYFLGALRRIKRNYDSQHIYFFVLETIIGVILFAFYYRKIFKNSQKNEAIDSEHNKAEPKSFHD